MTKLSPPTIIDGDMRSLLTAADWAVSHTKKMPCRATVPMKPTSTPPPQAPARCALAEALCARTRRAAFAAAQIYAQYKTLKGADREAFFEKNQTALWDHYYATQTAAR